MSDAANHSAAYLCGIPMAGAIIPGTKEALRTRYDAVLPGFPAMINARNGAIEVFDTEKEEEEQADG